MLSLREIIREEDQNTRVTLLEYLKQLHPVEWDNFVKDTKILAEESQMYNGSSPFGDEKAQSKADDLPFYCNSRVMRLPTMLLGIFTGGCVGSLLALFANLFRRP